MNGFPEAAFTWPGLAASLITVGGVTVTCEQARQAALILRASRTSAVQPVLAAAGHPLAACNYFAASAPWVREVKARVAKTGRAGAAGRHVVKEALIIAIEAACEEARDADVASILRAFASDERYASAMAAAAVELAARRAAHPCQQPVLAVAV